MRTIVTCNCCGHERDVARDALIRGDWRNQACPVCEARNREPPRSWTFDELPEPDAGSEG
jgi:hypothetical protein